MKDPHPENIQGEKVHVIEHQVNWGHVVGGVAALYVAWQVFGGLSSAEGGDDEREGTGFGGE